MVDDATLKVTLSEPYGPFLRMLTQMEFGVLPGTAADMAVEDFGQQPIGSPEVGVDGVDDLRMQIVDAHPIRRAGWA